MRRADHRIGPPNHTAIGFGHTQTGELAGAKAKACVAGDSQGEQAGRQRLHVEQGLASEFVGAGGHDGLHKSSVHSFAQSGGDEHRRFAGASQTERHTRLTWL
ncbi:hypothetical protein D3C76_1476570 [compost metagenome]